MRRTEVRISGQVAEFLASLAPDPRRQCRLALRQLERDSGDTKALEGRLSSYSRLRAGSYRFIFRKRIEKGRQVADVLFAERRSIVYELWSAAVQATRS